MGTFNLGNVRGRPGIDGEDASGSSLIIDENTPVANSQEEAEALELGDYVIFINDEGQIFTKLPSGGETPNPPTSGEVDNDEHTFTFTKSV